MLKYSVEGEKKLPFILKEVDVISTAGGKSNKNEDNTWKTSIYQNNDIYFYIEKNAQYSKEEIIKKIIFENFVITKNNDDISHTLYRPSNSSTYEYIEEYIVENSLKYNGSSKTEVGSQNINNQGGLIEFSILTNNIGEYYFGENEKIVVDGTLLNKIDVNMEDIKYTLSFDIIIETEADKKFKSNITLNLPTGDILNDGVNIEKHENQSEFVFKRTL
jgi:hypothetical protein